MSKHTPGPWELYLVSAKQKDGTFIQDVGDSMGPAMRLVHTNNEEAQANARLIARAPELLETLKRVQYQLEMGNQISKGDAFHEKVKETISKAIGVL